VLTCVPQFVLLEYASQINMRILITGGFGFIGGRLASHLSHCGHQIVLGSRYRHSAPDWLPQAEVAKLEWHDDRSLELKCQDVDVVIHAAGMNAQDCAADPTAALAFNGIATERLVAAANRSGVQRFIYLSTAHVYASPLEGIITEDTCPRNLHPYATSHLAGENAVLRVNQLGELEGVVLRLSNTFGVPMHPDVNCWMLLVNDLCRQAVETRELVLHTSGLQQRDFIGLREACRIVSYLAIDSRTVKHIDIFNIGTESSQSVLETAMLIQRRCAEVLDFEPTIKRVHGKINDRLPMLTFRTENLATLGVTPVHSGYTEEIDSLLEYCQSNFTKTRSD
jgi:UDP-glucose 4-epimerase